MTEILFILTTIYVFYVVHVILNKPKTTANPESIYVVSKPEPVSPAIPQAVVVSEQTKPMVTTPVVKTTETVKEIPTPKTPAATKKVVTPVITAHAVGLKNPKTGEVTTNYKNYFFAKRWIKEALVSEGLLEKIYTNKENNPENSALIKAAITRLEAMAEYRA